MIKSGLTASFIFEAESANYGEGFGNITVLKKLSRGDGNAYSYISRQALRYNMINQLGWDDPTSVVKVKGNGDAAVMQFAPNATIDKYPEIDLFGYMKTSGKTEDEKGKSITRSALARLSNAISLENFNADLDYLTSMGLANRIGLKAGNIAQSEIHKSYYSYTITIDLDMVGIDENDKIYLPNAEKAKRVKALLTVISTLYRDIKGRRENLAPIFAIGGNYQVKNPFFENRLTLNKGKLNIDKIKSVINSYDELKDNTLVGYISGTFANDTEINELKPLSIGDFFKQLCKKVDEYYV